MMMINRHATPDAKITLFSSLFRGREDVYPRRFESRRTGKSGYAPACANEWVRGLCDRKSVKCAECPHRRFLPVTDDVIRQHLLGQDSGGREFVVGIYPMLLDETCFLLAADFDGEQWVEDAAAVRETCRRFDVPCALERSRSGNGAHLWLFFEEALPAVLARKVGAHLLTETMERRPEIGLRSYDRCFPNQDTLPKGQLGNLIALPLQKLPRDHGNSVFLDDSMVPYADQWAFLADVRKIARSEAERIVRSAEAARGNVVGVRLVPW
ncbi:MAG TPA: restriction endonuclease subunit R, partial [Phycisphaerales bacterium]|nr:restriction endonuclease subunit R [Phycisphaerales bacterium]